MTGNTARRMWTLYEPVHAVTYFTPQARDAYEQAGLRGYWRGYFAGRAAPLGPVDAAPVTAAFFGFAPAMVARAIPDVWSRAEPARALRARVEGASAALRAILDGTSGAALEAAAAALEDVTAALDHSGRVLGAANAALPRPADPVGRLWQATTTLREHRGDGHVAALVAAGLDGCESLVLRSAVDLPRAALQPFRGWDDTAWSDARGRLTARGWLDPEGRLTPAGAAAHRDIEDATDRAAERPWLAVDPARVREVLLPLAVACHAVLPSTSPLGLPAPDTATPPGAGTPTPPDTPVTARAAGAGAGTAKAYTP